jgi:DNA excision repair protein ERCC-4
LLYGIRSAHASIEIFRSLKTNFDEPDVEVAAAMGGDGSSSGVGALGAEEGADEGSPDMEATARDILLSLPGINSTNVRAVINNVEDLAHLSRMSVAELTPFLGPVNAKKLFAFFIQQG